MLDQDQIQIGSIWTAADNGAYGYIIKEALSNGDMLVQQWLGEPINRLQHFCIDYIKLQYRYKPLHVTYTSLITPETERL